MQKPIWLLDIDGVINALGIPAWGDDPQSAMAHFVDGSYLIRWSPDLIADIIKLSERVEIRWLTTWGNEGNTTLKPMVGFPDEFPVQAEPHKQTGYEDVAYNPHDWKFCAALEAAREKRPLIWTDDDAWTPPQKLFIEEYMEDNNVPLLMIKPYLFEGLTPTHLDQIFHFVEGLESE